MSIQKRVLVPERLRRPPGSGFAWIDRRFMHSFAPELGPGAVFLYLFLSTVADKSGLSYYKDETIFQRIGMDLSALRQARQELIHRDLIAYAPPLYQVLSLPQREVHCNSPVSLGQLLGSLAAQHCRGGGS
jgi:hypothetical protein